MSCIQQTQPHALILTCFSSWFAPMFTIRPPICLSAFRMQSKLCWISDSITLPLSTPTYNHCQVGTCLPGQFSAVLRLLYTVSNPCNAAVPHIEFVCLLMQAAMYQNIGNISVVGVTFDSNVATGSGGGLYQNSFAGDALPLLHSDTG